MPELDEYLAYLSRDKERIERQFAHPEAVATFLQYFTEEINTYYSGTQIDRRTIGSSFILGDTTFGKLGVQTPQPYLGDSRTAFVNILITNQGSPFDNKGRVQIRDWLIGSSNAVSPTKIAVGSGTDSWNAAMGSLQTQTKVFNVDSRVAEGSYWGSFVHTILSSQYMAGSISEVAISGTNAMFFRDNFTAIAVPNAGSEFRISMIFRVGS